MNNLKTFENFEKEEYYSKENNISEKTKNESYKRGDVVTIRYWKTGDVVPVKIKEKVGKYRYVVSFDVEGNPIPNAPNMTIKSSQIIGPYSLTNDPVTFRNPMNVPSDFVRRGFIRQSNDIAINGYPKTLV